MKHLLTDGHLANDACVKQCNVDAIFHDTMAFIKCTLTDAKSQILSVLSSEALHSNLLSVDQATSEIPWREGDKKLWLYNDKLLKTKP